MRKPNKREQAVLDYLSKHKNILNESYCEAERDNDPQRDWYLGHAAEAISIESTVRDMLTGKN